MSCQLHKIHRPLSMTVEYHHIIPQAWQHFILGEPKLWDKRTIGLCPTSHRNVHYWIVRLMKGPIPLRPTREVHVAQLALERFTLAGYDLQVLRDHKLWGQA
jgi:hypothetical protein